jgi:murein DD-endopeptidase MepM/ murein hydrolase activator NlpD
MNRVRVLILGDHSSPQFELRLKKSWIALGYFLTCISALALGFIGADYIRLIRLQKNYRIAITENQHLKGEAQILMANLEDLKHGLVKVEEYAEKLDTLIQSQITVVKKETGIDTPRSVNQGEKKESLSGATKSLPLGISLDSLIFRPLFNNIDSIQVKSSMQALDLQALLTKIQSHSSLLAALPLGKPTQGWVASIYGFRISPFTGENSSHQGIDIAAPSGTPVYAPADGVVVYSGTKSGYGNFLMIAHGYGVVTRYGHNSTLLVKVGQRVSRGDQIAAVGDTGRSTGPHLHYEIWVNGRVVNPSRYILGNFSSK